MLFSCRYPSPVGALTLACDARHLAGLWLEGQKYYADMVDGELEEQPDAPVLKLTRSWLDAYFAGKRPCISALPLAPSGSAFRQAVWKLLCAIPYGQCRTYGEIARQVAAAMHRPRMSSQAVGGAVGHNPFAIIIPCHRVVGAGGQLTGYAGGIAKKLLLLEHEGVDTSRFFAPRRGTAL